MAGINFSGLTSFIPEAVNDMKDLIKTKVFQHKDLSKDCTIVEGIEYKKKIGYLNSLGDILMKSSGSCSLNSVNAQATTTEKEWDPRPFDTRIEICPEDFNATMAVKAFKKGVNQNDLTDTDYLEIFEELLVESYVKSLNRMIWMSELLAAKTNSSPAGNFSPNVDGASFNLGFVNMQNGLFWKAAQIISSLTDNHIDLSAANGQTSYAAQKSAMTPALALTAAKAFANECPLETMQALETGTAYVRCTRSFWNALKANFSANGTLQSMFENLQNGIKALRVEGIPFVVTPEFDYMINRYNNSGTKWINPHRALLYDKSNVLLGVPSLSTWGDFDMHYNRDSKKYNIDIKDYFDVHFLFDNQIMYAI